MNDDALDRWLADLRVDDDARTRRRMAVWKDHAADDATLLGVLADLAERGVPVMLTTVSGRRHRGRVLLVGSDAAVVRVDSQEWLVVRVAALASVRTVGGDPVHGEGAPGTTASFARLVEAMVQPGDWLRLAVGDEAVGGNVGAVSSEVVLMRLDNGDPIYVSLSSVEEASVPTTSG